MIYIFQAIFFSTLKTYNCGILLGIILNNQKDKYYYFQIFFEVLEKLMEPNYLKHINELSKNYKKYSNKDENIKKKQMNLKNIKISQKKWVIKKKLFL